MTRNAAAHDGAAPVGLARRRLVAAALAVAPAAVLAQAPLHGQVLPAAGDLARDIAAAAARGQPLVVMVTLAGCPYCDVVRRHYLLPLLAEGRVPVVQIDMRSQGEMRSPSGQPVREAVLARQWKVTMAPTVLFLGPSGAELAPRLRGYSEDFYGGYLDSALEQSRARLAAARRS